MKKIFGLLVALVISISLVSAVYCCEKTLSGAWCQEANDVNECNQSEGLSYAQTECENSGYCELGCCVDISEGLCTPNTAKETCDQAGGSWAESSDCSIPQCDYGCCLYGDTAAFVTSARCGLLGNIVGSNFRPDITDVFECYKYENPSEIGACVIEGELINSCTMETRGNCLDGPGEFHAGLLCTASTLNTDNAPSQNTICVQEKVYFVDSKGEISNIYDADKYDDDGYWTYIVDEEDSCDGDADSIDCGNCNYISPETGTRCAEFNRNVDGMLNDPKYGNHICRDLSCEYTDPLFGNVKTYKNGESWCATSFKGGVIDDRYFDFEENFDKDEIKAILSVKNPPGNLHYVLTCNEGEVIAPDLCDPMRASICIESYGDPFRTASCKQNIWQDCVFQEKEEDCNDGEVRDCVWLNEDYFELIHDNEDGVTISTKAYVGTSWIDATKTIEDTNEIEWVNGSDGICVPKYAPAYTFWDADKPLNIPWDGEGNPTAENLCAIGSSTGLIKYYRNAQEQLRNASFHISENEKMDPSSKNYNDWVTERNIICASLGDCGVSKNYLGKSGDVDKTDIVELSDFFTTEELEAQNA